MTGGPSVQSVPMIVLHFDADTCERILDGRQRIVTYDDYLTLLPEFIGQTVAIARLPVTMPCDNCGEVDEHECHLDGEVYGPYVVSGAIVGSATVADVKERRVGRDLHHCALILRDALSMEAWARLAPEFGFADHGTPIPHDHPGPISEWTP